MYVFLYVCIKIRNVCIKIRNFYTNMKFLFLLTSTFIDVFLFFEIAQEDHIQIPQFKYDQERKASPHFQKSALFL